MISKNNMVVYDKASAINMLMGMGFDSFDIDEIITYLSADALEQLEKERSGDNYELIADGYYMSIVNAINMIDEFLEATRITKPREKLEDIKNALENY